MSNAAKITKAFVDYLKDEGVYEFLPEIVKELEAEVFRNQDISVITATKLDEKEAKDIQKELIAKWGEHRIVMNVDPTILSGMIIRFQDNILDLSGRQSLKDMKESLTSSL